VFQVADPENHDDAVLQVRRVLGRVHHFDPVDKDALFIWDTMDGAKLLENIFGVVTLFFGCVAVVTLCLGGIGVMNIMLVSVSERTREIGVRKALGARRHDILLQFLIESSTIAVIGGAIGVLIGIIAAKLVSIVTPLPAAVQPWSVLSGLMVALSVGLFFGTYPASKAARLDPVEALRSE